MPKQKESRETAKAEYISRRSRGERVILRELAAEFEVRYQTLLHWKKEDNWEELVPKKSRGAQPGNQNCRGKRNAAGHHKGAPLRNKNAEKDGIYSTICLDSLSEEELAFLEQISVDRRTVLEQELRILKFREHKILSKIAEYESRSEDTLYINSLTDMREPDERGVDGGHQKMGMYNKDSAFQRVLKLQDALYKVQGRIAKIVDSLRAMDESVERMALERQKLELMRMRITGFVELSDITEDSLEYIEREDIR